MAYNIYSKAGTDEAISSALADSLPTAPADIGAATAAQGALADTERVSVPSPWSSKAARPKLSPCA